MPNDLTNINHYVPRWYQKLFISNDNKEHKYYYLDMSPDRISLPNGKSYLRKEINYWGPPRCFQEEHLYTLFFGSQASDVIEKRFFGTIDHNGHKAVNFFHEWSLNEKSEEMLHSLIRFMDAQKLRTPKGLDFLKQQSKFGSNKEALYLMRQLWQMHVTIWMEGIWEVLTCDNSRTKLIVSDHPVTTYNKGLFPLSKQCKYPSDAPISALGTHTIFPLGPTRLLVITNLGYVRNPWANPARTRVNPRAFEPTVFDLRHIQTGRELSEEEVLAVNYILKKRARRYIAAEEKEWLYPERHMKSTRWNKLGNHFFLMPDPRKLMFSTETLIGYKDGSAWGVDEYGRPPERGNPHVEKLRHEEMKSFQKHQKLWESHFGELSSEELRKYW